jgi:Plasmid pRiA4b ORF-3-like protein
MNRHLETCKQRAAQETPSKGQTTPHLHLQVEGLYLPIYWMHLDIPASATLETLDQFLRDTWLECCGHLSTFEIDGVRYTVDEGLDEYIWGNRQKHMRVPLEDVLHPGQRYSYRYDFGSTTELVIKAISEWEVAAEKDAIQVLARNTMPISCDMCGHSATFRYSEPLDEDDEDQDEDHYQNQKYLCDACAEKHAGGEKMLTRMMNSPRAGVCGYPG